MNAGNAERQSRNLMTLIRRDRHLLLMFLPVFLYFLLFCYIPMVGIVVAFKDFIPGRGVFGGEWVGFRWFLQFFRSRYFTRIVRNTFLLALYPLVFGFPIPILFAICLNEVRSSKFRRLAQTVTYLPHFISTVVVAGMIVNFLSPTDGIVNLLIKVLGGKAVNFMMEPRWFRGIYTVSGIWQSFGFSSIIYIAAILGIDPALYDACRIDGAGKLQELRHVTLPGMSTTIVVVLILSLGGIMSVGFEKVYLLYNPALYETADVISTYVYRQGIELQNFGYASAVGLFNSLINFAVVFAANTASRRITEMSLW